MLNAAPGRCAVEIYQAQSQESGRTLCRVTNGIFSPPSRRLVRRGPERTPRPRQVFMLRSAVCAAVLEGRDVTVYNHGR